jgi:CubicO group peptidase (beta-lactamase class C family)
VLALVLGLGPLVAQQPKAKGKRKPPAAGATVIDGELGTRLDALVAGFDAAGGGFSGVVLVARDGKVALAKGYGWHDAATQQPLDPRSLWDWASVSKQFTAAALLRLQDKKKLSLDDPLTKFWPKAPADKKKVTVRHLLNHTSGMQSGFRSEWQFDARQRESFVAMALALPLETTPGTRFEYSNSGYALAAALVEQVSGKSFEQCCRDELWQPAGMADAGMIGEVGLELARVPKVARGVGFGDRPAEFRFAYGNELTWGYRGCGGIVASVMDMLAWDHALRGTKVLSAAGKQQLYTVAKDDYALGWTVRRLPAGDCAYHSGGVLGVVTMYYRLLEQPVVVALACNYEPKANPAQLAEQLLARAAK